MNFNSINNIFKNDDILDNQLKIVLSSYFDAVDFDDPTKYNFRCNVCGDSKTSTKKRRAFILKNNNPWMYYCHNCQIKMPVTIWLKEYFNFNYKQYIKESLMKKDDDEKFNEQQHIEKLKQHLLKEKNTEKEDIKCFKKINLNSTDKLMIKAIEYCRKRLIPENVFVNWCIAKEGSFKNRLIITFINNAGKVYYWQGRALYSNMIPKYLSRVGEDLNSVYNCYNVDKDKPVIIVEGPIDSLFLENSIAMTGLKIDDKRLDEIKQKYFLLDDDKSGKEIAIKLLTLGHYCFNWKKFKKAMNIDSKVKDVNDVILQLKITKFTFEELEPYFTNSIFDEIYFK